MSVMGDCVWWVETMQAVKMVKANHRLLLSGTPIQNNALELWSLFDFLMPVYIHTFCVLYIWCVRWRVGN